MEDLGARLEQLLSDPQALSQIGELAASLGLGQPPENGAAASPAAPAGESSSPDLSALLGMLGGRTGSQSGFGGMDPALLGRIAQVVASLSVPDRDPQLVLPLLPLCEARGRKRVEEAAQILRIIRLLPLLEDGKKEGP